MHDTPNKCKTSSLDASADVSQKLQVAVVGGGIAGLSVAISLLQHPGVNVQIYERTKVFREIGASISLGPNGLRTLEKLGVENALDGSVCSRQISDYPMIYRHWRTGEVMARDIHKTVKTKKHFTARFHRAHLHQALLEHVPSQIVHMGKKTISILADREEGVTLTFEDHTTAKADIFIGADGIHSVSLPTWGERFHEEPEGDTLSPTLKDSILLTENIECPQNICARSHASPHWLDSNALCL